MEPLWLWGLALLAAGWVGWHVYRRPSPLAGLPPHFTVVDIETTGLSSECDAIIELAAIKVRLGEEHPYATHAALVNPGRALPAEITRLTGITEDMLAERRGIREETAALLDFVGDDTLVFYYASFDMQFLRRAAGAIGRTIGNPVLDAVPIARRAFPRAPNHKLTTLSALMGHSTDGAHRALHDCIATLRVIQHARAREAAKAQTCMAQKSMRR